MMWVRKPGWARLVLPAMAAFALLAGCGDDDDGDGDGSGAGTTATQQQFKGDPVTIFVSAALDTALADIPEVPAAVRAGVKRLNDDGGLDGHEVKVEVCNDRDANAEVACARKAQKEGAIAFAGSSFLLNPTAVLKVLEKADIPSVAPFALQPAEYSSKANFPIDSPAFATFGCPALVTDVTDRTKVAGIGQNLPTQQELLKGVEGAAKGGGIDYVGTVYVPQRQTDFAPAVQELKGKGAEVVVTPLIPATVPAFTRAATTLGEDFAYCSGNISLDSLAQTGPAGENYYLGSTMPPTTEADKYPLVKQFVEDMKAAEEAGEEDAALDRGFPYYALRAWLGVHVIGQAAEDLRGELTAKSLTAALNKAKIDLGGITPPLDFSKPVPAKGFERAFNPNIFLVKYDPATKTLVRTDAKAVNVLELLGGAKG